MGHMMRTNIDIDDSVLDAAMRAGPFKTKKDAVEAGLKLLARQAAYREVLRWEGKLRWDGDAEVVDADGGTSPAGPASAVSPAAASPAMAAVSRHRQDDPDPPAQPLRTGSQQAPARLAAKPNRTRRHAGG